MEQQLMKPDPFVCFTMQMAFQQQVVTLRRTEMSLPAITQEARNFLEKKFGKQHQNEQIMLFRHCFGYEDAPLKLLSSTDEIEDGTVLEIVLSLDDKSVCQNPSLSNQRLPAHRVASHTYLTPTFCDHCGELLVGLVKQGLKCQECKRNFHQRCVDIAENPCGTSGAAHESVPSGFPHTFVVHSFKKPTVCKLCRNLLKGFNNQGVQCYFCRLSVHKECAPQIPKNCVQDQLKDMESGSPTLYNPALPTVLYGWLLHFTDTNFTWKRHYWHLDPQKITLFQDDTLSRKYKSIPLSTIINLRPYNGTPVNGMKDSPAHRFEIQTVTGVLYVTEVTTWNEDGTSENAQGITIAEKWFHAIFQWLLPPDVFADRNYTAMNEFREKYQLCSFEKLGTGHFGQVFGGIHRQSQMEVAVKLIWKDKSSLSRNTDPKKQQDRMNEIAILWHLNHPGIVKLMDFYEFPTALCVVMEKMRADMLTMILSNENRRLPERVTKFLIYQVLRALQYLHEKGISHRDLKPENVLVSSPETDFPQCKLCDFGVAKIIGEATFMKSIVGTKAYLAPEVNEHNKKGYSKSVDMWSLGCVIYVTLSGVMPFDRPEYVEVRVADDEFMFPAEPWNEVSDLGKMIVKQLLQIQPDRRLTSADCFTHKWFQDDILHSDLRLLEDTCGIQYLTESFTSPMQT